MSAIEINQAKYRTWRASLAPFLLALASVVIAPAIVSPASAQSIPPVPILAPFDAPLCENTTGNPSVDADGGPVTNLLSVFGQRLTDYNAGRHVVLYNNQGRSGWTAGNSQYASTPLCMVRYVDGVGPVSDWAYCTYDRASVCGWTNANGELERNGVVLTPLDYVAPDARLTENEQKLQAYILQNDIPIVPGPNGTGGTVINPTVANNDTPAQRTLRQNLLHCIDNPDRDSALVFCENNMSAATQARILEIIGPDAADQLNLDEPGTIITPGDTGEITLSTTLAGIELTLDVVGGTVSVCDGPATLAGNVLVVDVDAVLPAEVTLCATRADAGTVSVTVRGVPPSIQNTGFVQSTGQGNLCQIFSLFRDELQQELTASAEVVFGSPVVPVIGTTLVVTEDGSRLLPWNGGLTTDTVAYQNLTPGVEYTLLGELMNQADSSATGIIGQTTFTPAAANGSVEVELMVPEGFAGMTLVAFEWLFLGNTPGAPGDAIAQHTDINDPAQTISVEGLPGPAPVIGTSLVDAADGDQVLPWNGGTLIDTVAYQNLTPGVEYTLLGELMNQADSSATGITGQLTFTPPAANGSVAVTFVVPEGYAGMTLVAFEWLFLGNTPGAPGDAIAEHTDINDPAQTIIVEGLPGPAPVIGTSLVDAADGDQVLPWNGGTLIDTVAYQNLTPGVEYTLLGELMNQADSSATGITGQLTFTPPAANGSVAVTFVVPEGYAGMTLVAFEWLFLGNTPGAPGDAIAVHTDINDPAQTITVEAAPVTGPNPPPHFTPIPHSSPASLLLLAMLTLLLGGWLLQRRG